MTYSILYLLQDTNSPLHKIGVTNNWSQRSRQLEVGTKTRAVMVKRVNDAGQLEKFLHRRFKHKRLPQSEWFNLTEEELGFVRSAVLKAGDDHAKAKQNPPRPSGRVATPPAHRHPTPVPQTTETRTSEEERRRTTQADDALRAKQQQILEAARKARAIRSDKIDRIGIRCGIAGGVAAMAFAFGSMCTNPQNQEKLLTPLGLGALLFGTAGMGLVGSWLSAVAGGVAATFLLPDEPPAH